MKLPVPLGIVLVVTVPAPPSAALPPPSEIIRPWIVAAEAAAAAGTNLGQTSATVHIPNRVWLSA
ncbi:MAG: hypothetical protein HY200_03425 [Nitrospirae bacterium]|nr:hypothetical protein [Nitrospirota bacterium]